MPAEVDQTVWLQQNGDDATGAHRSASTSGQGCYPSASSIGRSGLRLPLTIVVSRKPTLHLLTAFIDDPEAMNFRMFLFDRSKSRLRMNEGGALQDSIVRRALDRLGCTAARKPFNRKHQPLRGRIHQEARDTRGSVDMRQRPRSSVGSN